MLSSFEDGTCYAANLSLRGVVISIEYQIAATTIINNNIQIYRKVFILV